MSQPNIRYFPGWTGVFTDEQAEGALPNGTRVIKVRDDPQDAHPAGTTGRVLGSVNVPETLGLGGTFAGETHFYFIEWEVLPRTAIGVVGSAIEKQVIRAWRGRNT